LGDAGLIMSTILAPLFVHLLVVVTPGPANILIMQRSAAFGRSAGLSIAAGVVTGAAMWATTVFLAITFSYALSPTVSAGLGVVGAAYLAYLGFKIIQGRNGSVNATGTADSKPNLQAYFQGFLLHATNPKAFFGWLAIISVGRVEAAAAGDLLAIVVLCTLQALVVFSAYALVFSSDSVVQLYQRFKPMVDVLCGIILIAFALVTLSHLLAIV
jgi:threonine/homoserine/homoserine lactone efflux protein